MWPFIENEKMRQQMPRQFNSGDAVQQRRPMKFFQLVEDMGDFSDLKQHDSAMKFWLPEPANEALEELASINGHSMSEALRQFFVTHCYGVYAYQIMTDTIPGLFRDPESIKFSEVPNKPPAGKKRIDTYWVPELGKNVASIKVWIPSRVRQDLQLLADHVGIKLSQYVREIIISRLLGHGTLPKRPEMIAAFPLPSADDWSEDREVPMRQVNEDEYLQSKVSERRTEWVDI